MRSYGEFCPLARALDLVGERWTMLIIRELSFEPRRFTDLRGGLSGIASNLLAERLRSLEEAGVVTRHQVLRPVPGLLYGLTPRGHELLPILRDLARWGVPLMSSGQGDDVFDGRWLIFMVDLLYSGLPAADGPPFVVAVAALGETVTIRVEDTTVQIEAAEPAEPDVRIEGDPDTLFAVLSGALPMEEAVASGGVTVAGTARARRRLANLAARVGSTRVRSQSERVSVVQRPSA